MNDVFFRDLGIRPPDHHLGVGSGTHAEQTGAGDDRPSSRCSTSWRPDAVVVVGDVNSTAGLRAGRRQGRAACVAHVEAGLRSRDWSMPEEVNRVVTDRVSDYCFAPSPDAVRQPARRGLPRRPDPPRRQRHDRHAAGQPGPGPRPDALARHGLQPGGYGLVTLHRPANVDDSRDARRAARGAGRRSRRSCRSCCPCTRAPRPGSPSSSACPDGIRLVPPAGYLDFIALQAGARMVLTDSGGIQEETTALGVPCLTLRDNTERPDHRRAGHQHPGRPRPARASCDVARQVLATIRRPPRCPELWDGRAGDRIADAMLDVLAGGPRLRPTDLRGTRG